jgi:uncharacterized membrane protein YfhO
VNKQALGNAWFVKELDFVKNADEELSSLGSFDPAVKAVADEKFNSIITNTQFDISGENVGIKLTSYTPNHLMYEAKNSSDGLAVFSEIYYPKGWNAYVDGKKTEHIRVNYILRALPLPAGNHSVEFKFEPSAYYTTEKIAMASSSIILLLLVGFSLFSGLKFIKKEA